MTTAITLGRGSRLLTLYSYYSLFLALAIVVVDGVDKQNIIIAGKLPDLFLILSSLYVFAAAVFVALINRSTDSQGATTYLFLETALLTGMMFASGGLTAGFSSLLIIPVIMANLLAPGVLGYSVAAWLSLAVIYTEHISTGDFGIGDTANTGVYGSICFAIAWLTQLLSYRINAALNLASDSARQARRLQKLSQQALMKLPDGVIACSVDRNILFINDAASHWFKLKAGMPVPQKLANAKPEELIHARHKQLAVKRIEVDTDEGDFLLLVEDEDRMLAEVQQVKLASLGRLTASIAHEIRNPLSSLQQAAQLLSETKDIQPEVQQLAGMIENNSQRINRIIADILQLSRGKRPQSKPFNLKSFLEEFRAQFQRFADHDIRQFEIACSDDITLSFDPDHLNQILTNLCQNGLRYAKKANGTDAQLGIRVIQETPDTASITVSDNGLGVADNQIARLFEPFSTTEHSGTGLGLYLCRELCQGNQATIEYAGSSQGAQFVIHAKCVSVSGK
ncbi:MAG: HAMP domain-containing sensor histidine kinase [Pseudomonadota bacterium]|nr:HAMP domain-containing sensor histidine kinase [Pseudomonadota bacterium]MEE2749522.1 HAMP domain-containing sensor histidine kinase [Pseudomonadota bacterium]